MGLFSSYSTHVSTHVSNIYEKKQDIRLNALMSSLASEGYFAEHLKQEFINGLSNSVSKYKNYATTNAPGGIPVDRLITVVPDKKVLADFLGEYERKQLDPMPTEPLDVKVTEVLLQSGNYDFFMKEYMFKEHGYDPYTSRVSTYPNSLNTSLLNYYNQRVAAYNANLEGRLPDLIAQVPQPSTTENIVTYNGETMTQVTEYTYEYVDNVSLLPSEHRYGRLIDWTIDGTDAQADIIYNLNLEATINVSAVGKAIVQYTPKRVRYYVDSEGNQHGYSTMFEPTVINQTNMIRFTDTFSEPYTMTFEPEYIPHDRYYYIEYYINKSNGTKEPKILVFSENVDGTEFSGFPTYDRPTVQTDAEDWQVNYYLPAVRLRSDNTDLLEDKTSDHYKYARGQLSTIGVEVDQIREAINSSPDIGSIDEAFFFMGFDVNTDNESSKLYIAEFFNYVHREFENQVEYLKITGLFSGITSVLSSALDYTIAIDQEGFKSELRFTGITHDIIQGHVGPSATDRCSIEVKKVNGSNEYSLVIKQQLDSDTYRELVVNGLHHVSYVFRKHKVITRLEDVADDPLENRILIPFNVTIFERMSATDREMAVYDSLKLVMHAYERTKLKWYQSSIFKAIVLIVAVVITIYSGYDAVTTFSTVLASSGTLAAIKYLAILIVNKLITYYVISYAVQMLGEEFAILAAVALLVYGGLENLEVLDSVSQFAADQMMQLSLNISKAVSDKIEDDILDLNREMEDFLDQQTERALLIEETEEQLYGTNLLKPYASLPTSPILSFNESPSRFLERTGQINNPGVQSIEAISSYVEANLNKGRIRGI
ncbi:MAG: hypothetical protein AXW14_08905 [Alteromonas sp. Nap_26]|nr:MAG: hypothetical protein AXW14_08905 [Alteromonas sp. Nap_26]